MKSSSQNITYISHRFHIMHIRFTNHQQ